MDDDDEEDIQGEVSGRLFVGRLGEEERLALFGEHFCLLVSSRWITLLYSKVDRDGLAIFYFLVPPSTFLISVAGER